MRIKYIPELNGLRAIAIIAVIAYHSKIQYLGSYIFGGGFFGVDIFFIISGYLMTLLIINEYKLNKIFSWKKFIIRRIKRIVPALFFWIIISLIFGYFFFLPRYNIDLGKSALSSLIFLSNIYYYLNNTIYSDIANLHKSLLHTWSLSLEMQFYFTFPFLIIFFYKNFKKNILVVNFIIILLLFLLSAVLFYFDRSFAFYNLPSRLWQFFLGSTVYFLMKKDLLSNNIYSYIGFFLILLAIFFFENNDSHLVFISILPSIGTFLLINNLNKKNLINKFLSFKIIIFIGTISYSLYLVHYILMSFFRVTLIADNSLINKLLILTSIIVLSIASYYLVEKPFKIINYKKIFNKLFSFIIIILAISLSLLVIQSAIRNDSTDMFLKNSITKPWEVLKYNDDICFNKKDNFCYFKNKNNTKEVILLGDSTIASIQSDLVDQLSKSGFNVLTITRSNCFYLYNISQYRKNNEKTSCDIDYQKKISNIVDNSKDAVVIVYFNYNTILKEFKYKKSDKENIEFISENEINKYFIQSLEKILQKNKIIIIYPTYVLSFEPDRKLYSKFSINKEKRNDILKNKDNWITYSEKEYFIQNNETIKLLNSINNKNLLRVFPNKIFCGMGKCLIHDEKDIYYYDQIHFNKKGSILLSNKVMKVIKDNNL